MILIVEDEKKLSDLLRDYLQQSGYETHCVYRGDEVMEAFTKQQFEAVLLDLMLPGKDGLSICREIRAISNVPILMVTAKVEEIDRLLGLELGADDYICKPYSPREVVARVKTVLRRVKVSQLPPNTDVSHEGQGGSTIALDDQRMQIHYRGKKCEFTAVEYELIKQLVSEPGRIYSRSQLMDSMYSDHRVVSDRTIDSHIKKIRRKLTELDEKQEFISSVYGVGYRFDVDI